MPSKGGSSGWGSGTGNTGAPADGATASAGRSGKSTGGGGGGGSGNAVASAAGAEERDAAAGDGDGDGNQALRQERAQNLPLHRAQEQPSPSQPRPQPQQRAHSSREPPAMPGEPAVVRLELLHTKTPVEGCDLSPFVIVRDANGDQKTAESMEGHTRGALSVQYRWHRREYVFECVNTGMPAQIECLEVSRAADAIVSGDDDMRRKLGRLAYFRTVAELRDSWATIRQLQQRARTARAQNGGGGGGGGGASAGANNGGDNDRRADSDEHAAPTILSAAAAEAADEARDRALVCEPPPRNESGTRECGFVRNYAPTADDVGHTLRLECRYVWKVPGEAARVGPPLAVETLQTKPFTPPPPERRMQLLIGRSSGSMYSVSERGTSGEARCFPVRVLSYNCLAELYASADLYSYCPDWALAWTYRRRNLLREIVSYEADVICLQEVQGDHFEEHFKPAMRRLGYEGVFKAKMREAMGRRGKVDGCATFFKADRFALVENREVEYSTAARNRVKDKRLLNRLVKDNVGHLLVLESTDGGGGGGGRVCIANTHIFWDPDQTDVKLFQVDTFLQEAEEFVTARATPLIIAGDFNSLPDSSVYELVVQNEVSGQRGDIGDGMMDIFKVSPCRHRLMLRSVYGLGGEYDEPRYTNYTSHFVGTLDFLFFTQENVIPVGSLEILDEARLLSAKERALPNARWSSDHVAVMADFDVLRA